MADGVGSRSYNYDQLSRMISETQTFSGLAGYYALTYGYNLANQLTSLAEPSQFGTTVNYVHDSSGKLTAVTGSGGLSAQILTGMQYRAWGGLKHASYGDGPQVNVTYNARLLPTRYELNNVYIAPLANPGYYTVGTENQYHPDGRLRYARDLQDDHYDRAFAFDQASRLKEAYMGREARGLAPTWPEDSPYRQTYSYDVWNNMGRTGRHWTLAVSDTPTYTNDRRSDWSYDASGNVTSRDGGQRTHAYDAAGRQRHFYEEGTDIWGSYWLLHQYTIDQTYDGDGRVGKRIETRYSEDETGPVQNSTETSYELHSSVLGGALIAKISQWGTRERGHVYTGGELIAEFVGTGVNTITMFQHQNPTTGQWVKSGVRTELDPLGADVGYTSPYAYNMTYSDIMGSDNLYSIRGNALDIRGGCALHGMPIPCSAMTEAMAAETGSMQSNDAFGFTIGGPWDPFGPLGPVDWHPDFLDWLARNQRELTTENHLSLGREWLAELLSQEPAKASHSKAIDVCDMMANDAQHAADAAINGNPMKDRPDLALGVFNREFGMFTFGTYFTPNVLGFLGTQASGRDNVLGTRSYQGSGGFPAQFWDSKNPYEDQIHHFGAYLSAGIAGHKFAADIHRADDRDNGNMGDVRLSDQARRLGDYLRRNPSQLDKIGQLIRDTICKGGPVPK